MVNGVSVVFLEVYAKMADIFLSSGPKNVEHSWTKKAFKGFALCL